MSITRPVRVRFAPSPTGSLHIGGLRTALFNWLFARHHHGSFILRIEDTDQKRYDPNALDSLIEAMRWAGLDWDEGPDVGGAFQPYVQSERLELYQKWANWLVEQGKAYRSYETSEELERRRKEQEARKELPGYNRAHRSLTPEQRAAYEAEGRPSVVRFTFPLEGDTTAIDLVHGEIKFENARQQDAVLLKSDGFPTYHLAHIVDDHFMEISHVLRSAEWLPSLPLHVQLWQAFGWEIPEYAHLPAMLNPNGKGKMSKRNPPKDAHGNVIPVLVHDYMNAGYLPDALVNFLANIGWNFGDEREIFTMAEAIERFDLTRINPANSAFPPEKLEWLNSVYIRETSDEELAGLLIEPLAEAGEEFARSLLKPLTEANTKAFASLTKPLAEAGEEFARSLLKPLTDAGEEITRSLLKPLTDAGEEITRSLLKPLTDAGFELNTDLLLKVAPLVKVRIKTLNDVVPVAGFFFREDFIPAKSEEIIQKKMDAETTARTLEAAYEILSQIDETDFCTQTLYDAVQPLTEKLGVNNSQLFGGLRVAVTGQTVSTPTFETMEIIGKQETLKRVRLATEIVTGRAAV